MVKTRFPEPVVRSGNRASPQHGRNRDLAVIPKDLLEWLLLSKPDIARASGRVAKW
jgi:hypothetical protein